MGQRKLLLAEVEFLTQHGRQGDVVVYAGAAPGTHLPLLIELFPFVNQWHLFDPRDCCVDGHAPHVRVYKECFTDQWACKFASQGKNVLFISDIRAFEIEWQCMPPQDIEQAVRADMDEQMRWHQHIQPRAAMHKFRLPYARGTSLYLDGQLHFSIYGPQTSTESRLWVVEPSAVRGYDHQEYIEKLMHFNTVTRLLWYHHNVTCADLDHCGDCAAEVLVWRQYLERCGTAAVDTERSIAELITRATWECSVGVCKQHKRARVDAYASEYGDMTESQSFFADANASVCGDVQLQVPAQNCLGLEEPSMDDVSEWDAMMSMFGYGHAVPSHCKLYRWVITQICTLVGAEVLHSLRYDPLLGIADCLVLTSDRGVLYHIARAYADVHIWYIQFPLEQHGTVLKGQLRGQGQLQIHELLMLKGTPTPQRGRWSSFWQLLEFSLKYLRFVEVSKIDSFRVTGLESLGIRLPPSSACRCSTVMH